uniref:Uncharacterized protein n=1 Tax=Palpitomonas bilix TaxID=652834 RepID=A0A7S3GHW7_9EUKA|mmetsp:Transcript_49957/g.128572  ORF Transcript_49957/g.128572 Transcript_49957/m.128572 type:complete len:124 (+) Transcript_49957:201-572(+)|eukprot:CAMPEP_0113880218 /NCGR_PEP_ID=MMETSP0780_2-20120614/7663_1 /TAXON_ID=652834 /ORGANISM="Palpitomonas bilix" /LENGTH=123 /DNA_ID=CAMNT_0000866869 /DNA_START=164 /DNA_END=535 /DNA_ORIENTATION=- /assembly_acc=CAM_ASM_000599
MEETQEKTFKTKPELRETFKVEEAKEVITSVLKDRLGDQKYSSEDASRWTKEISDDIKSRIKDAGYSMRYKIIVQVIIGEQRGEGVKVGCRCFWDSNTDRVATETFINESIFCVASAWAVYYY